MPGILYPINKYCTANYLSYDFTCYLSKLIGAKLLYTLVAI